MDFLRKNLFFVILPGSVLVLIVALGLVRSVGPQSDVEQELQKRQALKGTIGGLSRQQPVNGETLEGKKQWVNDIRSLAVGIQQKTAEWNRRNYQVLQVVLPDGRKFQAFPVNKEAYEKSMMTDPVTREYINRYNALLDSLEAVAPVSVEKEVKPLAEIKQVELARDSRIERGQIPEKAEEVARNELTLKRAADGRIYVDRKDAQLDRVFTEPKTIPNYLDLWHAQVNLWVTTDILTAIREVNGGSGRTIYSTPVKRLVATDIDEAYYVSPREQSSAAPPGQRQQAAVPVGQSLTTRQCGKNYDVVHYNFTVDMLSSALPDLLDKLMARSNHTVLNVQMTQAEPLASDNGLLYYYGTQPVVRVKVEGELLLLTAWERGTAKPADPKARPARDAKPAPEWVEQYPPLITLDALKDLAARAPESMRPEDQQRIQQAQ